MAKTVTALTIDVNTELGSTAAENVAAYFTGTGTNAITTTSDNRIMELLNDAKDEITRTCFLTQASGTLAATAGDGPTFALSTLTTSGIKAIRRAIDLFWTPTGGSKAYVQFVSPDVMRNRYPQRAIATTGSVLYWSTVEADPSSVEVYQRPAVNGTYQVDGYYIPSDFTMGSDTTSWLPDEYHRALIVYVCAVLCRQRLDDDQIAARGTSFALEYDRYRGRMRDEYTPSMQTAFLDDLIPMVPQRPKK